MEQKTTGMVYSEEEYLDAVRENTPASTKEVADAVGVTRQGADYRLRELEEDGKVTSKMAGNSLIWMVVDEV
ncbi:helix-turn-helix domain-containing protein (plasmid) [Natrinema thermotolerans]|uniref:Helix-turn-helix domain-containing protein n=1 Tax=Natrinema thermotolerans TaxID=121872 RepID=A0AAF0PE28_9EURY|nr:winged helix-turn-helix domain-containing protein [Natrinema thermotolerans]QCC57315.1 ArsR family transcriptional regulator [Natrinema thermotolerans]WMT10343.1 helix-turn-helix domain-containing protein [Natrinema thermotolerans]